MFLYLRTLNSKYFTVLNIILNPGSYFKHIVYQNKTIGLIIKGIKHPLHLEYSLRTFTSSTARICAPTNYQFITTLLTLTVFYMYS